MTPGDEGSVTRWLGDLKAGDPDAAQKLWERYFASLVRLAHARLRQRTRGVGGRGGRRPQRLRQLLRGRGAAGGSRGSTTATTSGDSW